MSAYFGIAMGLALMFLYGLNVYKQGDMGFMNNDYTFLMVFILGFLAVINGVSLIFHKNKCARLQKENTRLQKKLDQTYED